MDTIIEKRLKIENLNNKIIKYKNKIKEKESNDFTTNIKLIEIKINPDNLVEYKKQIITNIFYLINKKFNYFFIVKENYIKNNLWIFKFKINKIKKNINFQNNYDSIDKEKIENKIEKNKFYIIKKKVENFEKINSTDSYYLFKVSIKNKLKINKFLFFKYNNKINFLKNSLIYKDLIRTKVTTNNFLFLEEINILLEIFILYRNDINYVQGMNLLMSNFKLIFKDQYITFKIFSNFIVKISPINEYYKFNKNYIEIFELLIINKIKNKLKFEIKTFIINNIKMFLFDWILSLFCKIFKNKEIYFLILNKIFLLKTDFIIKIIENIFLIYNNNVEITRGKEIITTLNDIEFILQKEISLKILKNIF